METQTVLAQCSLFAGLPAPALARLAALCSPQELHGGEILFHAGEPSEYFYVVASGLLCVGSPDGTLAGEVTRFEPLGEISLLSGEPHSAQARALRDSLLLRIRRDALVTFLSTYPSALLETTRVIVRRMRSDPRQAQLDLARRARSRTLLPARSSIDGALHARKLHAALAGCGVDAELIDPAAVDAALGRGMAQTPLDHSQAHRRLMDWLNERECAGRHLLYCAAARDEPWTERCLRQSDRVLLLVEAAQEPQPNALLERVRAYAQHVPVDLVLLRPEGAAAGDVLAWRERTGAGAHHFLRPDEPRDYARLARQLSGRGIGLVLSGGGARGFAHIGLIRALEELEIPVDLVCGTSMGAFFAALLACGHDSRELQRVARETFVEHNYLNDYVLPRVSLIRGRKFLIRLRELFGERRIEELRLPYFCVSTNLTQAKTMIHDHGPLALWVGTSMAVPGIAPPVVWRGDLLVDGAVTNSLPTDLMRALGRGPVIASDVSTEAALRAPGVEGPDPEALLHHDRNREHVSLIDILFGGMTLTSESGVRLRASRADLYLRMPVSGVPLFGWKHLDEVVERGYQHALQPLAEFKRKRL
jgi:NTE family protein